MAALCLDPRDDLQSLIELLVADGYLVLGPVARGSAISYDEVTSERDLPSGCTVEQGPGRWRLSRGDDPARFSWTPGADSWKRFVFPARSTVLTVRRRDGSWATTAPPRSERPLALLGARDCELRALGVLDRVFLDPDHPDPRYADRRRDAFIVAVTCGEPASTCWCTSIGGGPEPHAGYDLRITELLHGEHRLLMEPGTDRGQAVLDRLRGRTATARDRAEADDVVAASVARMPVRIAGTELPHLLAGTELHARWGDVAARCLSCGNCTLVCPTCFCSSFHDTTGLDPDESIREQEWASCFQLDHSSLGGGHSVRDTIMARYRQWLTHKLETWPEQFGTTGCVGCGRCTTWCPAGIDIVEEAGALIAGRRGDP